MAKKTGFHFRVSILVEAFIAIMIILGIHYLAQPAISLRNDGFWWFMFGSSIIVAVCTVIDYAIEDNICTYYIKYGKIRWILSLGVPTLILILIVVLALTGAPINNADTYKNVIAYETGDFAADFEDISSYSNYVFMDLESAQRLGDRVLGTVPNATWYEVDKEYNLIVYQGRQYRVSPLKYGGLFKYNKARSSGIPGYVLVDCETGNAQFVESEKPIRYSPSAYFGDNLKRHLRSQYPDLVFDGHFMEIDEEGYPWWVTAVTEPKAGVWGARVVTKFILTDACTGESQLFNIEEKPEWLDHVQGLDYMMNVLNWNLRYIHGWWNPSNTDVLRTTYSYAKEQSRSKDSAEPYFYGYTSFVNSDGDVMVFTGITPANKTESNKGFMLINANTGEYKYYPIAGAEESSAQSQVEVLISNYGYQATFPFMVNVAGHPTYLMAMKGKSGLIQKIAMVNMENYSQAYVGDEFEDTLSGYLRIIGVQTQTGNNQQIETESIHVTGEIAEKFEANINGTTFFYYVIDGELYRASIEVNEMQVLLKAGDSVEIDYVDGTIRQALSIEKE